MERRNKTRRVYRVYIKMSEWDWTSVKIVDAGFISSTDES